MPPFDVSQTSENRAEKMISPCGACPVRGVTVCAALAPEELSGLAEIIQVQNYQPQTVIFSEDDPASYLYNVTSGTLKLYKLLPDGRRQITGFLSTGDFLGLSIDENYAYTTETVTAASVCKMQRNKLEALMDRYPKLQRRMFSMASNELAAAQDQMLVLGRKSAREKICSFMLLLSRRSAARGHTDNPVHVPMSRVDIADYLGLTTETVSRTFTQLKTSGVIQLLPNNRIKLNDMPTVYALAEGG